MISSERSSSDLSEYTLFQIDKNICMDKNKFLGENWTILLSKFSDSINSDNCIGKTTSISIRLYRVFLQKRLGFFPIKDMQTPPSPLRSGHLYIKDGKCAESNEKSYIRIFRFLVSVLLAANPFGPIYR